MKVSSLIYFVFSDKYFLVDLSQNWKPSVLTGRIWFLGLNIFLNGLCFLKAHSAQKLIRLAQGW